MHPDRLNVLLLHCHDVGRFLGCYQVPTVRTPHLDRLAAGGVRFDAAFATAPQCSPSRASLVTGRWPQSNGVLGLTHGDFGWDLHPGEQHLASLLSAAGYRTELIGVHHESRAGTPAEVARRLGFDRVQPGGRAAVVADRAVAALRACAARTEPFYLQVGFHEPHRLAGSPTDDHVGFIGDYLTPDRTRGVTVPAYLHDDERAREELAELQGAVHAMDATAGQVLQAVTELGLDRRTVVLFTTDHGLALPRAKGTLYDPGLEIALLARAPALGWTGGRVVDALVSNVDLVPTLLATLGLPVPAAVQGRRIAALAASTGEHPREEVFGQITYHDYYDPRRCIRTRDHKLIVNFSSAPAFMDTTQSWRPRTTPRAPLSGPGAYHPPVELYDLRADPLELANLAGQPGSAELVAELGRRLRRWLADTGDPILAGPVASPMHHRALSFLAEA